jgi:hypothetical protein
MNTPVQPQHSIEPTAAPRRGMGYIVVIVFAGIMMIFMTMIGRFRSGQMALLSKGAKEYLATTLAEAGANALLAEFKLDNDFRTHETYKIVNKDPWTKPIVKRPSNLANYQDLVFNGVANGRYTGKSAAGEFKLKVAKILGKNNPKTVTLRENLMYHHLEVVAHVGDGRRPEDDAYRKITMKLEKRSPFTEYLLYDGELLDTGFGPFDKDHSPLQPHGRLYGYQYITFSTLGARDRGVKLGEIEKIETPGMIRALKDTPVTFPDKKAVTLNFSNDSTNYDKFQKFDGLVLDGAHGAHPLKFTHLPKEDLLAKAQRKNSGGYVIDASNASYSDYINPYNPSDKFMDLDFGRYNVGQEEPDTDPGDEEEDEDEGNSNDPPYGTDDPPGIREVRGKRLLIYSKIPLRVWGCPDRSVTIFCEKDIVVGGDFNQNPTTPQDYENISYTTYKSKLRNGKRGDKVGALLMSMGRVLIDVSRPSLFMKNETKPFFLYHLALSLEPNTYAYPNILADTRKKLCPLNPLDLKGLRGKGPGSGTASGPNYLYATLGWLADHSSGDDPEFENRIAGIRAFFTPESATRPNFPIFNELKREIIIQDVVRMCQKGMLTPEDLTHIFETAWEQARIEEFTDPGPKKAIMAIANYLSDEADKDPRDGIHPPEITINAALVSSTRRSSRWKIGNTGPLIDIQLKAFDEIGNGKEAPEFKLYEYLKKPRFIIQRVFGSEIRLASTEPTYYIDGRFAGIGVLRRRLYDRSLTGGNYQPKGIPFCFNVLTYRDETITHYDYKQF